MKLSQFMESTLLTIPAILCALLLWKLISSLRSSLPWRVNCWFCNSNIWVKYIDSNCWTCPKCDQYNGFTKDGDYNRVLCANIEQVSNSPKLFQRSPSKNGLCRMCNINQQLKVTQLANFVPMNEKKYYEEIDSYRTQLEKAYKLCSPCEKFLQKKLHKEKVSLLGSKLLETRTSDKNHEKIQKQSKLVKNVINSTSRLIAIILLVLVVIECHGNASKHKNLSNTIHNVKDIIESLVERIFSIVKMKTLLTFPSLEDQHIDIYNIDIEIFTSFIGLDDLMQKALGGVACIIQIIGHIWNINKAQYCTLTDLFWSVFILTAIAQGYVTADPLIMSLIKLSCTLAVLLVYRHLNNKTVIHVTRKNITPKKLKNFASGAPKKLFDEEDTSLDTDSDVSLSKFGLHNFTDSSNETASLVNHSLVNGRSFTPRNDSLWSKPKLNSTFTVNSVATSPKPDSVFIKPNFNQYQKIDDSDSELDESISLLCISSPKKKSLKSNPVFALRKFTASPFVVPTPMNRSRPVISPSKLGHSTSWVAGGYWGTEGERQIIFNVNGSRSSSQSSGFESQASSLNQRNIFSQPSSREESVCGEPDKHTLFDRFQNCNMNNYNQNPSLFAPVSSPVYPQMQYNSHVQIPQPRLAQQTFVSQNVFAHQQFAPRSMFKAPIGSRLIKLPQDHFVSR
ncbi:transmembrane protein 201 [Maniola jurtina]|uniref:transmembrane protein 201 n=1 Tax=Maniola jurtina TaxID=191418 RepID=UPI001E689062|nr:transmembrane protein 201 [Maniola jurtina]